MKKQNKLLFAASAALISAAAFTALSPLNTLAAEPQVSSYIYIGRITEDGAEEITRSSDPDQIKDILNNLQNCPPYEITTYLCPSYEPSTETTTIYTEPSTEATTYHIESSTETTTAYTEPTTEATTIYTETTTETTTVYTETSTEVTTHENPTQTPAKPTPNPTPSTPSTPNITPNTSEASQILNLVNTERAKNGLSPLTLDSSLNYAAALKAQDMADLGYFSHTSPTYGSPFDMLKSLGISYKSAGENIAKGQKTPEAVMTAWLNSDGHRANILNSSYGKLGVGCIVKNGTPYWVQIFTD